MKAVERLKEKLEPGAVYRRAELERWSNSVDRHIGELIEFKVLKKIAAGVYYYPRVTAFGEIPPSEQELIRSFLKDSRFLVFSWNKYNILGVGTTQLYTETIVYNHKRHGVFQLGNRKFRFVQKGFFPEKLTEEFLLVDLVNNLNELAEDTEQVLENVESKALNMDHNRLLDAVLNFGGMKAKKYFAKVLNENGLIYGH